ncbi:hypothetical protein VCHSUH04_07945 [Veillonella sp. T14073-2]|uniref:hypothetical protein n=1 Tax=Veillonella sp. T14073-2 TaxID=1911680 RepID=UPI000CF5157B|nr:hypothetical protein [Veillonella sp. T14073-2]PQL21660.1 hypothetical protein VCHSUH04_07945 [Veillonella sp. T14073-2]
MKIKSIFVLILLVCLYSNVLAAIYPQNLFDNPSYQLINARQDKAIYMDASSIVLKTNTKEELLLAVNEVSASFDYDRLTDIESFKDIDQVRTVWYYKPLDENKTYMTGVEIGVNKILLPPYIGDKYVYYSTDNGYSWMPFDTTVNSGPTRIRARAFNLVMQNM